MTRRHETIEGRLFLLTIVLIILGVFLLKFTLDVDFLDRRMTKVEAAVEALTKAGAKAGPR